MVEDRANKAHNRLVGRSIESLGDELISFSAHCDVYIDPRRRLEGWPLFFSNGNDTTDK